MKKLAPFWPYFERIWRTREAEDGEKRQRWHCAGEISKRTDGAPVFNEFI